MSQKLKSEKRKFVNEDEQLFRKIVKMKKQAMDELGTLKKLGKPLPKGVKKEILKYLGSMCESKITLRILSFDPPKIKKAKTANTTKGD